MIKPYKFELYELVDKATYERFGEKAWWFFDPRAVVVLSWLRRNYGRAWVNNWYWGGHFQYRGFRPLYGSPGADYSMHRLGKAFDITFEKYTAKQVRDEIREMDDDDMMYSLFGGIEKKVNWLHIDTRTQLDGKILWFDP